MDCFLFLTNLSWGFNGWELVQNLLGGGVIIFPLVGIACGTIVFLDKNLDKNRQQGNPEGTWAVIGLVSSVLSLMFFAFMVMFSFGGA